MKTPKQQLIELIEAVVPDDLAYVRAEVVFNTNKDTVLRNAQMFDYVRRGDIRQHETRPSDYLSGQMLESFTTDNLYGRRDG